MRLKILAPRLNRPSRLRRLARIVWLRRLSVHARMGLVAAGVLLVMAAPAYVGEIPPVVLFAINLLIGSSMGALAVHHAALRRKLRAVENRLSIAETQTAHAVNFNDASFADKSELIELTLNHMNQGVAVIRPDGYIWLYNKRALEYSGVDDQPFPPTVKRIAEMQLANEEFGPEGALLPDDVRAFLLFGKGRPPKSYIRKRPNGTILEVRSDPMPDGSVIQTYTDITELALAKEAAEAAARAKASFLATMSHEIGTPLNGVIVAAKIMRDTPLSYEQERYVDAIESCGESLLVLLNDILDYSKFETVGVELDESSCDPRQIIRSAVLVMKSSAELKGLHISIVGLDDLPAAILADAKRLRQVLLNFLGNAIKFTDRGSVTLKIELPKAESAALLRVSVIDTGIGIAPEALDRLFKEFSQVENSIARRFGGTGLGLAISHKLVDAMRGRVGVNSTVGVGSEFWFEIPLQVAVAPAPDVVRRTSPEQRGRALRILVAEDVPTNQLVIGAILKRLGHSVDIANDGVEAVNFVQDRTYDLVMLDMQMPIMDGLEATRRIRRLGGTYAEMPIVAVTANAFASDREACFAAGMNGFITKPFEPSEIDAVIAQFAGVSIAGAGALDDLTRSSIIVDPARISSMIHWTAAEDVGEFFDVFADEADALTQRLNMLQQTGARADAMATVRSLRTSCLELGLMGAASSCDSYLKQLAAPDAAWPSVDDIAAAVARALVAGRAEAAEGMKQAGARNRLESLPH